MEKAQLEPYEAEMVGTWHTHPRTSANLSPSDYYAFASLPALHHFIVSEKEIRGYYVSNGKVMNYEKDRI